MNFDKNGHNLLEINVLNAKGKKDQKQSKTNIMDKNKVASRYYKHWFKDAFQTRENEEKAKEHNDDQRNDSSQRRKEEQEHKKAVEEWEGFVGS